jgi:hypothetical protein
VHEFLVRTAMRIPSVVKIHGYCLQATRGQAGTIVMELIENGTRADALKAQFSGVQSKASVRRRFRR